MSELNEENYYQDELNENIELSKALAKVTEMLNRERKEKEMLRNIHEETKHVLDKTRKENNDLNSKYLQALNSKSQLESKYEAEIARHKAWFDKQKESYEQQILKLSASDVENMRFKINNEVELKYRSSLEAKQRELDESSDKLFEASKKFELVSSEYEHFKADVGKEFDRLNEKHKSEIRELVYEIQVLSEKCDKNVDRDNFNSMKAELDSYRKQFNDMQNEIVGLRREKDYLLTEKNEVKLNLMKELDQEKLKAKIALGDQDKTSTFMRNFEMEVNSLKDKIERKNEEIKELTNEKINLDRNIREMDNDYEAFKAEIRLLRQKIEEREYEISETLKNSHEKEKNRYLQEKLEKEQYQKQIEELNAKLSSSNIEFKNYYENTGNELHGAKRDFYILMEEKRMMMKRITELQQDLEFIRGDYEKKLKLNEFYERELNQLNERVRELNYREAENFKVQQDMERMLKQKAFDYETLSKSFNEHLQAIKDSKIGNNSDLTRKLEEVIKKKNYYKKKIYSANQNLTSLLAKVAQKQNIDIKDLNVYAPENDIDESITSN